MTEDITKYIKKKGLYIIEYNNNNKIIQNKHYLFYNESALEVEDEVFEIINNSEYDTFRIGFLSEEQTKILLELK